MTVRRAPLTVPVAFVLALFALVLAAPASDAFAQ
jgi:hypothetical protein